MPIYKAPVEDTLFVLDEVLQLARYNNLPGFSEATPDMVEAILTEAGRVSEEVLLPVNATGDAEGCIRHEDGSVTTPNGFRQAYAAYRDGGWIGLAIPEEFGGQGLPYTLHCAVGAEGFKELEERQRQWSMRGAPVRLLDARETAARLGSNAYAGALFDPRAGTLQPLAYARGLAHAAQKAGVELHGESRVESCERAGNGWRVATAQGSVTSPWVIVATDAYSTGPFASVREEQVHLPYFNFATAPLGDNLRHSILPGREGCWDTREILSSFRMDKAGRLVFGSVGALRNTGLAVHRAWAQRSLKRIFPQLGDIGFEAEWYGKIGMTTDAVPRFHRFADGIVGFSGYNGRGIAPGTVFGQTLARLVLGEMSEQDLPLPLTEPTAQRFRAVKEAWYEAGAQVAHFAGERF